MTSRPNTTRTVVLSVVALLALAAVVVVAVLIVRDKTSSPETAAPTTVVVGPSSTSTPTPTSTSTPTSTTTPESTHTRPTGAPGSVIYQLTGDGEVVGVAYRSGSKKQVVVITGTPWQQKTTLTGRHAELSGIVVRGRITCTIMQGEELLASSTSGGGPFSCKANLPH